jgi:hypothetical protein
VQLERIAIGLRPRNAWESMDLGYAMVQEWWRPVMKAWLAVYVPIALIVNLLCWKSPIVAVFIMWWLKPAFDRVVLHVLSGATFGSIPTVRETLRALKQLWWKNGLFAALTYTRFNFTRSFSLPVVQLEGSRGKFANDRRKILGREGFGPAVMLTVICMHLEVIIALSLYLLINLFSPGEPLIDMSWRALTAADQTRVSQYFSNAVGAVAVSLLEPFYVAGGFALYLNCRSAIEGWDVELTFKRLAARVAEKAQALGKRAVSTTSQIAAFAIAGVVALSLGAADHALADPCGQTGATLAQSCPDPDAKASVKDSVDDDDADSDADMPVSPSGAKTPSTGAAAAAKKVLASKEFGEYTKGWELRYIGPTWDSDKKKEPDKDFSWFRVFAEFAAQSVRVLVWVAVGALVLFLFYLITKHIGINGWGKRRGRDLPDVLFGLDVRPESLPDDVPAAARLLLDEGDVRAATGLLYRGALVALIQDGRIDIARGDTELECVARVRRAYGDQAITTETAIDAAQGKPEYFRSLVTVWQRVAYARERVPVNQVAELIVQWPAHFAIKRGAPGHADQPRSDAPQVAA